MTLVVVTRLDQSSLIFVRHARTYWVACLTNINEICATRVTTTSVIQALDGNGPVVYLGEDPEYLAVASNGTNYLLAVNDGNIHGVRLRASDGVVLDTNVISFISPNAVTKFHTAAASDGTD